MEESQITWDMNDRRFWPKNLTLFERPHLWKTPTYDIDVMRYKGRIVHDHNGDPIRNFRIPLTISSKVEGLRMESWMRSDDRLTLGDIEARVFTKDGRGGEKVPVFDKRALSKRASNARTRAGLISWATKKGTETQKRYLRDLRTKTQDDSNLALGRDLTSQEKAHHAWLSLNEERISDAPTRANRIQKILRTAGKSGTVAGPSSGAANAGPSDSVAAASGDDDDLTDDTDGDEAAPETQIRDQASDSEDTDDKDSVSSSLIDPLDSRHDEPTNPEEEACLRDALANTVEEFVFLVDQEPQPTNPGDNYFSQWGALQEQFRAVWAALGNEVEAPRLRARDRWTGGISQWYFAEEIEAADDDEPE